MCGIVGLWHRDAPGPTERDVTVMRDALRHRGPDGEGVWIDREKGLALGHRRLSIIDLSEAGAQPMRSASGRYALTYNGEIYNAAAMRAELEGLGRAFRGHSDTEVALAAIEEWGLEPAVGRFVGMFAFALFDRERAALHLVRDRLGIKPLYVAQTARGLAFASELSAIARAPGFEARIDRETLAEYFRYACVPRGRCIYEGAEQVQPGTLRTYRDAREVGRTTYWSALDVARRGLERPLSGSFEDSVAAVSAAIDASVRDRLVSDVPLGVFLSGGIDSSLVTASMTRAAGRVRSFSIGFGDASYDEAADAERVARHLGTEHTTLELRPERAMREVDRLGEIYAEPFADSSQLPTYLVCALAREHVTVALSGDGGDELFGGYNRHVWGPRVWGFNRRVPAALRGLAASALRAPSPDAWDRVARLARVPLRTPGDKAHKLAGLLDAGSLDALYLRLTSIWPDPARVVIGAGGGRPEANPLGRGHVSEELMYRDMVGYLPDDILTKVDRASMAVSLEVRVPLLDHRVVELAWRVPLAHKIQRGQSKRVLRAALARDVPRALFERPKMGFGVPIDRWLRGPLRDWAEALLDPARLRREGYLDADAVSAVWRRHLDETGAVQHQLWAALMFQRWLEARAA